MLIEDYDLEVEISPCRPDSEELVATVRLNVDITPVLPYLNRTLRGAAYNPGAPSLAWKKALQDRHEPTEEPNACTGHGPGAGKTGEPHVGAASRDRARPRGTPSPRTDGDL